MLTKATKLLATATTLILLLTEAMVLTSEPAESRQRQQVRQPSRSAFAAPPPARQAFGQQQRRGPSRQGLRGVSNAGDFTAVNGAGP